MKSLFPILLSLFVFCNCAPNVEDQTKQDTTSEAIEKKQKPVIFDLNVEQFKAKMTEENIVILDVRTPEETAEGKIAGAIEIDYRNDSFEQKIAELDKDKTYLVYCRSGGRSLSACEHMASQDFKNLNNLLGGYTAWNEASE